MKRILLIITSLVLSLFFLSGCQMYPIIELSEDVSAKTPNTTVNNLDGTTSKTLDNAAQSYIC